MYPHSHSKTVGAWISVVWFTSHGGGDVSRELSNWLQAVAVTLSMAYKAKNNTKSQTDLRVFESESNLNATNLFE